MANFGALNIGAKGIKAFDKAMNVVGNNIANMNTPGYKRSTAVFSNVLGETAGRNKAFGENQIGGGSQLHMVNPDYSQGAFKGTNQNTDMAIDGSGFFVTKNPDTNLTTYTRAGAFNIDKEGYLVSADGSRVQGWRATTSGGDTITTGKVGDIDLDAVQSTVKQTSYVEPKLNLDADASATDLNDGTDNFDPADDTTYNFKTDVTVYDSLGSSHKISMYFSKTAENGNPNEWNWKAVANAAEVDTTGDGDDDTNNAPGTDTDGDAAGELFDTDGDGNTDLSVLDEGSLEFNDDGSLQQEYDDLNLGGGAISDLSINTPWTNGADSSQTIDFDLGTSTGDGGDGLDGVIQRPGGSVLYSHDVDGQPAGSLEDFEVNTDGVLVGSFTNGSTQPLFKLALAEFKNVDGLTRKGGNQFVASDASGDPAIKEAGQGGVGTVRGFALEESNVDASKEFTRMIQVQRGYQANTKVIKTVDDMLNSLMSLKR